MTSIVSYYNNAIQELNSTNLNDLYDTVLEYAANTTFAGSLVIGAPSGNNTLVGYFTDTVRSGGVGSDGITILSNTYTISQYTNSTQTTPAPNVVSLVTTTGTVTLQENYNIMSGIADNVLARMVTGYGTASYYLGNTIPIGDTGVWQNLGKLEDTLNNFTELNQTYFLWKKLSTGSSKTLLKPLKLNSSELIEFTTGELNNILYYVEQRFLTTGVGTYVLNTSVPVTGTWSNVGVVTDFIRTIDTQSYNTDYSNENAVDYTGVQPITYSGPVSYVGDDGQSFVGSVTITYSGPVSYVGDNGQSFVGSVPTSYLGPVSYVGDNGQSFVGSVPTTYAGPVAFTNVNAQSFVGSQAVFYNGPTVFLNPDGQGFVRPGITYSGPASFTGSQQFVLNTESGWATFRTAQYTYGPSGIWAAFFVGPSYLGPRQIFYTGTVNFVNPNGAFFSTAPITYLGPRNFVNPDGASFVGFVPTSYLGPVSYVGDNAANFTGFVPTSYLGPATFTNPNGASFVGFVPTSYLGPATFTNPDGTNFTSFVPTSYLGPATFTNPDAANFTGFVPLNYSGTLLYETLYEKQTVAPSLAQNPSVTLWVRIG